MSESASFEAAHRPLRLLIIQPQGDDGPAALASWLTAQGRPFTLCHVQRGDPVPTDANGWDAIAMLGGAMSVNDDLPWLHRTLTLMRDAVARGVPVVGHCLGGQMLARALDAAVTDNPVREVGWRRIERAEHPLARVWLGDDSKDLDDPDGLHVFHWHEQTFALPDGAVRLATNADCANQAYAIGPHLGMQFHIEVDATKLEAWCRDAGAQHRPNSPPSVQDEPTMRADTQRFLPRSLRVADRIYTRWIALASARAEASAASTATRTET